MLSLSLQQLLFRFAALLFIVGVHGWAVSAAAVASGDNGPKYDGRRTCNPLNHLDLLGALGILLFSLGWIRLIAIDRRELRSSLSPILIALAGLAAVFGVAVLARLVAPLAVTQLPGTAGSLASVFLSTTAGLALWFMLFNLLPLPPLTGGLFLMAAMPRAYQFVGRHLLVLKLGLAGLIVTGLAGPTLAPVHRRLLQWVLNLG